MKTLIVSVMLVSLVAVLGCKSSETGGMSGKDTFKITVPAMSTDVKQGETALVRVVVDRGEGFKQSVKLEVKAPKGLDVDPGSTTVKPGDKEGDVQLKIKADKDAPLGEQKLMVMGTPDVGEAVEVEFKVNVIAK
jgi:uncharacterized membrane protein